jgi:hypothetical protein
VYLNPADKLRYCWRCRRRLGRGPGTQVCTHCKTYNKAVGTSRNYRPIADIEERIACYVARADQELDLFEESPYRRLPGAHNRLGERQTKLAGTTGRIAAAGQVKKLAE